MKQRIFFDFGGCLDAPGIHTRKLFWQGALESKFSPIDRALFQEAYTRADQQMMKTGEAKELGLAEFNFYNAKLILQLLGRTGEEKKISDFVTSKMDTFLKLSKEELEKNKENYNYSIISNFTGNLQVILKEYNLLNFFSTISESYYVGASKPDLRIFQHAIDLSKAQPAESYYIGDNPKNDINPGNQMGFKTVLIFDGEKMPEECNARYYVRSLEDFFSKIQSK